MNILTKWLDGQQPLEVRYSFIGFILLYLHLMDSPYLSPFSTCYTIFYLSLSLTFHACFTPSHISLFSHFLPLVTPPHDNVSKTKLINYFPLVSFDADHTLHYQTWWILRHHRQYFDVPQSSSWDQDCNLDCWTILHTNLNHMKVMMDIKVVCSWVLAPWFPYAHTNTIGTIPSMIIRVFNARTSWSVSSIC